MTWHLRDKFWQQNFFTYEVDLIKSYLFCLFFFFKFPFASLTKKFNEEKQKINYLSLHFLPFSTSSLTFRDNIQIATNGEWGSKICFILLWAFRFYVEQVICGEFSFFHCVSWKSSSCCCCRCAVAPTKATQWRWWWWLCHCDVTTLQLFDWMSFWRELRSWDLSKKSL